MSGDLQGAWNAHSIYTNVREDRRQILSPARTDLEIVIIEKSTPLQNSNNWDISDDYFAFPNNTSTSLQYENQNGHETFDLIITKEE